MRRRSRLVLLAPLVPLALALVAAALLGAGLLPDPPVFVRANLAALIVLAGLAGSALAAAALAVQYWGGWVRRESIARTQAAAADDRRRFLGRLDHELKNPLTAIRAGVANLAEAPSAAARQQTLGSITAQTLRLSRLAADLRKLAELETRPLERMPTDLAEILREVVALAGERPEAGQRRLTLSLPQAPWPLPAVAGDRDLLFLTFYNLVDNAIKFTRPGDTVEVRAFEDGPSVAIEVADTGPGIPEADAPHVWEELYRGQAARSAPGSGLGLALVRAVVARHGGRVGLRSREGQGTVVTVRLPSDPAPGAVTGR